VTDQQHLRAGLDRVDRGHDGIDVFLAGDARSVSVYRLHARQGERMRCVAGVLQPRDDGVPRSSGQPEAGDQNDVHVGRH
jgi:hypothetical protein